MDEPYTITALSPIRKIIASRMVEATRTIPHFRLVANFEVDALLDVRTELRRRKPHINLTLNDLLVKACATALMDSPAINIQWSESGIRHFRAADISVVTAIEGGLTTPIVRNADSKSIWDLSREIRELTARASTNGLKMEEIVGGSFSLSNLGMYGIDNFDAIINPPQCAILAIGAARQRVLVTEERKQRVASVMTVTLSVDHRAIDGATGANFMSALRERIEQPAHLLPERNT